MKQKTDPAAAETAKTPDSPAVAPIACLLSFIREACAWTTGTLLVITFLWVAGYSFVQQWPASGLGVALGPVIWGIGYWLYRVIKWARKICETDAERTHSDTTA